MKAPCMALADAAPQGSCAVQDTSRAYKIRKSIDERYKGSIAAFFTLPLIQ